MKTDRVKKHSITTIASLAGVSVATVSRVINNDPNVAEATRRQITALVEKYSFQPKVVRNRMPHIGLLIETGAQSLVFGNFISEILNGVHAYTHAHGLDVSIVPLAGRTFASKEFPRILREHGIHGMFVLGASTRVPYAAMLDDIGMPYVLYGSGTGFDCSNTVSSDEGPGIQQAVEYLSQCSYRTIGYMHVQSAENDLTHRRERYQKLLQERGRHLSPDHDICITTESIDHCAVGRECMQEFLAASRKLPDALICATDDLAMGAMSACAERGITAGKDIGIIGFDDLRTAQFLSPPLATVANPIRTMASYAAASIHRWISGRPEKKNELFPTKFIPRESCPRR